MANLQDLCLSAVERTGTDVNSVLGQLREILPERILSRHPVLMVEGVSLEDLDDGPVFERKTKLTVQYTGVYHLLIEEKFSDLPEGIPFEQYLPRQSEEIYSSVRPLVKRLLGLMNTGTYEVFLYNPVKQKRIFEVGNYDTYILDGRYGEDSRMIPQRIEEILESLPDYIHI